MQAHCTTKRRKRGRRPLSPHGLDQEFKKEAKKRHQKKRKPASSRRRTEMNKRRQGKLRRARREQLRRCGLREPLGRTVRRRIRAVRYYPHWRQRLSEGDAAHRAALKYRVSESTIRRCIACTVKEGWKRCLGSNAGQKRRAMW